MNNVYTGKLFDAMAQIDDIYEKDIFEKWLVSGGVDRMALFSRNRNRPRIPHGTFYRFAESINESFGDKILLGTSKRFDQSVHFSDDYIKEIKLQLLEGNRKFIGELMFSHADKADGDIHIKTERYVDSASPTVSKMLDMITETCPVPVMIHWEVYHWERDMPSIMAMLQKYPNLTFIWIHCGFAAPWQVDHMLSNNPNLVATITKREMIRVGDFWISHTIDDLGGYQIANPDWHNRVDSGIVDALGIVRPEWHTLIEKYQDRLMWGTDAHKPLRWQSYLRIIKIWRKILPQFNVDIIKKITYNNAMRIYNEP
jgi:hypothetical protein